MHQVSFDYKGKPKRYQAPTQWNQLTAVQLIRWAAVVFGSYSPGDQLRLALLIAYGFEKKIFKKIPEYFKAQFSHTVNFLFAKVQLTRWLIKDFPIWFTRYYGPADALTNLSAHEFFNYTEVIYRQFHVNNPDENMLNALCAVLYREKRIGDVNDDIRCILTDAGVARRSKRFAKLNPAVKYAILLNYEGCRQFIIEQFDEVFEAKGNGNTKAQATDLVLALAGPQLGTYTEAKNINLYKFLEHTTRMIQQAEESKQS